MNEIKGKYTIAFLITKEEKDYYDSQELSHHDFYKIGQEAHKRAKKDGKI